MKRFASVLLFALLSAVTFAQTTVTFQVTDADSIAWNSASYQVYLSSQLGSNPTIGSNGVAPQISGTLSTAGGASFSLSAGTYTFRVVPLASGGSSGVVSGTAAPAYSSTVAVSGSTQTVTLAPPAIRIPIATGVSVKAYGDVEVTGAVIGSRYLNVATLSDRVFNGASWNDISQSGYSLQTAVTAAPATLLTYTPGPFVALYRACFASSVNTAASGVVGWTLGWKDSNGNAHANVAQSLFQSGVAAPALTFTTSAAGEYYSCSLIETDNSATNIILKWVGGGTSAAFATASIELVAHP